MAGAGYNRDTPLLVRHDRYLLDWPALRAAFERWLDPDNFDGTGHQRERLSDLTALILVARG
ncbi:MAG: hypothetical protein U0869_17160 [Chloroflexota bacterium]